MLPAPARTVPCRSSCQPVVRRRDLFMIEATGLHKVFATVTALRDVSLQARDGAITGLLGPNGAGKSTTLRILYTVISPNSGDAFIDGISAVQQPLEARRRMGVLPHNAGIYPHLTA